jgi:hypothetical protein
MDVVECPHCFTRVIPKADGLCPACQQDTRQSGEAADRALIRVAQGDVLPPVCCDCGCETDRYVTVRAKTSRRADRDTDFAAEDVVFTILLGWLFFLLRPFTRRIAATETIQVKMPQCPPCGKRGLPTPRYVDFDRATVTFLVHRNLKDQTV